MLLNNRRIRMTVVICLLLLPLSASAQPASISVSMKPVEIQVENEARVSGEQVVLGDVATIYAKNLGDFKTLSGLVISKFPDDKDQIKLPASYLEGRVRAALPSGMDFVLRAPAEIVLKRLRLGISSPDFANEIIRLARNLGKIPETAEAEVLPLAGMDQLKVLSLAKIRIEPSAELERWKGDMAFKILRSDGTGESPPLWVRARVRWFQKAWIASRQFGFSESVTPAFLTEGRLETTNLREEPVFASREELEILLKSSRMKRALAAGAALMPSMIERRPDAFAGSLLRVVFISEGGVRVSADGSLVGPGSIGADVKAKLRSSRKIVTGKLVSQSVVEVSL